MPTNQAVAMQTQFHLLVPGSIPIPVRSELLYDPGDPLAVRMVFHAAPTSSIDWVFARSLLIEGLDHCVGLGDVSVGPTKYRGHKVLVLSLTAPSGHAVFHAPLKVITDFLARTLELVPVDAEASFLHLDAELAHLLD